MSHPPVIVMSMRNEPTQLVLIDTGDGAEWRLDDSTREAGRRGVAEARLALQAAARQAAA